MHLFLNWFFTRKKEVVNETPPPIIEATKEEILKAIRAYSEQLPKGVYRTVLVNNEHQIDTTPLVSFLGGIPSKPFYMSKETYDIFEEHEKHIPPLMDKVQKAVDTFLKENKKYPVLDFDPLKRINSFLLLQEKLLDVQPEMEFYLTNYDGLITHIKPKK